MRPILIVVFIIALSCQAQQEAIGQTPNSAKAKNAISSSFLDSIAKKYELSVEQIRSHTAIDSIWYTGRYSDAGFTGDTVFPFSGGFTGAIIKYDDRLVCSYKFLLVFSPPDNQNTAYMEIYSSCDRDESADYTSLRYKLLSDSSFETIESYTPAHGTKVKSVEKYKWEISDSGTIYSRRLGK